MCIAFYASASTPCVHLLMHQICNIIVSCLYFNTDCHLATISNHIVNYLFKCVYCTTRYIICFVTLDLSNVKNILCILQKYIFSIYKYVFIPLVLFAL